MVTVSPRKAVFAMRQSRAPARSMVKRPLRVAAWTRLLMASASGERLHDVQVGVFADGVGERRAVAHLRAVHEDEHVFAERALVVDDVTAQARVALERSFERLAHRARAHVARRTCDVTLQVLREGDARHRGAFCLNAGWLASASARASRRPRSAALRCGPPRRGAALPWWRRSSRASRTSLGGR